ncbi:MAG: homoserine kinase [Planctomycetes bacterium]|nr:homoserine kinase [Planctomycetota bacterium]
MAVYTEVATETAAHLLRQLGLGDLTDLQGIRAGVENTNYYATSTRGQWVLTVFERLSPDEAAYGLGLMRHVGLRGVPVPVPQADAVGHLVHTVAGKPAAVVTRLPGSHRTHPDRAHAGQVGHMLARLHQAASSYGVMQRHPRGAAWRQRVAQEVLPHLDAAEATLLRDEIAFQDDLAASPAAASLPSGPIHGDLFRDNVMFDDTAGVDRLCGLFDFYFAGTDALLFDVAVCLNDWCTDLGTGRLEEERAAAFVDAYASVRPLVPAEVRLMPGLLRAAALRFWLSRLADRHAPRAAALLQAKDPAHFARVLAERRARPWHPAC